MATVSRSNESTRKYTKPTRPLSPISDVDDGTVVRVHGRIWIAKTIEMRNSRSRRTWVLVSDTDFEFITYDDADGVTEDLSNHTYTDKAIDVVNDTTQWVIHQVNRASPHLTEVGDKVALHSYKVANFLAHYFDYRLIHHDELMRVQQTLSPQSEVGSDNESDCDRGHIFVKTPDSIRLEPLIESCKACGSCPSCQEWHDIQATSTTI